MCVCGRGEGLFRKVGYLTRAASSNLFEDETVKVLENERRHFVRNEVSLWPLRGIMVELGWMNNCQLFAAGPFR